MAPKNAFDRFSLMPLKDKKKAVIGKLCPEDVASKGVYIKLECETNNRLYDSIDKCTTCWTKKY